MDEPGDATYLMVLSEKEAEQARFITLVDAPGCIYGRDAPFFAVEAHGTPLEDAATSALRPL
jgi:hypothetical protein